MKKCKYCGTELTTDDVVWSDRDGCREYVCSKCHKRQ